MHLFIRRPDGSTFSLSREHSGTVQDLKNEIQRLEGLPFAAQRLAHKGVPLSDDAVLGDLLDSDIANVELNVELLGGAKKRKKKVYTTPKKTKRKLKKIKLAALKFYKVDTNGKVTRLRRECPNKECGAGVFMASHFDRHYCGKCGLTYMHENK
ncbi:unnamed protein product [Schistocephalus solidus]|uniref:Ubiquitin-40S ribosomal protein S27a n=1 Tax=Schistocephalus solidus TaxID=70667 RepID=A0A0X3NQR8_SCHSO|nr:unnamed protein product [Schistocephalus solidus]